MKKIPALAIAACLAMQGAAVNAAHKDVIENKFINGCNLEKLMPSLKAFNEWAKPYGYNAEVFMPIQSSDVGHYFWVGTSADFETFGKAFDAWLAGVGEAGSAPARLNAEFSACSAQMSRQSYITF